MTLDIIKATIAAIEAYDNDAQSIVTEWLKFKVDVGSYDPISAEAYYLPDLEGSSHITFTKIGYFSYDQGYAPEHIAIPIEFIEFPEVYKAKERARHTEQAEKKRQQKIDKAKELVASLEDKLVEAKADLYKTQLND